MNKNNIEKYKSEELQEISLTSNINSYRYTILFVFSFIVIGLTIASLVKYPEKIIGEAFIVSENKVNNIYSPNNGEILLLIKENDIVEKGQLLALINSPTNYYDIQKLKSELNKINVRNINKVNPELYFDNTLKLGEIEKFYHSFLLAITEYNNLLNIDIVGQKISNLKSKILRNNQKIKTGMTIKNVYNEKHKIVEDSYELDSILFKENAIVKDQITKSKLNLLGSQERQLTTEKHEQEINHYNQELNDEIKLLSKEKQKSIATAFFNVKKTFFELKTTIDFWEYNFSIKAPVSGKIEFYQPFFNSTQYVKKDMPLFILLPKAESLYARGIMSANGYGKIKEKDTVYIKLNDYPYKEYGELKGFIYNKSKVYHDSIYYIDIRLPFGLKTNHNESITFSYNMSGKVEYLTNKRSILQRIFNEIQNSIE